MYSFLSNMLEKYFIKLENNMRKINHKLKPILKNQLFQENIAFTMGISVNMIGSALESFHIQSKDSMKNVFEPFNNTVQKYKKLPQNFNI